MRPLSRGLSAVVGMAVSSSMVGKVYPSAFQCWFSDFSLICV